MGIAAYNEECRSIVMRYAKEWEAVVQRVGRWIDFEDDYKTLDANYMESVWWVFRQLHDKGLVYRGFKVPACPDPPLLGEQCLVEFVAWYASPQPPLSHPSGPRGEQ